MSEVENILTEEIKFKELNKNKIKKKRKTRDEVVFCLNFILTLSSVAIIFGCPTCFAKFNTIIFTIKFIHRIFEFHYYKWDFYLIDFCYIVNFLVIFFQEYFKNTIYREFFFFSAFGFALGPILFATFIFNYGFVFHNTVKFTSFWIHYSPGLAMFLTRWHNEEIRNFVNNLILSYFSGVNKKFEDFLSFKEITNLRFISFGFILNFFEKCSKIYFIWFVIYYLIIFKISYKFTSKNGYLTQFAASSENSRDKKYLKIFGDGYEGIAFMFMHFRYVGMCISISFLFLFSYQLCLITFIMCILTVIWNTSTYYIEYFSRKYEMQFEIDSTTKTPI